MSKEQISKENQKIITLSVAIIIVIAIVGIILIIINNGTGKKEMVDNDMIQEILSSEEEKIVYVENSDTKKCSECKKIKKHLNSKNINYLVYDTKKNNDKEYTKMLQMLSINRNDFNYPAILYIKDGSMYANIININDTKVVDQFIKDYSLEKVK